MNQPWTPYQQRLPPCSLPPEPPQQRQQWYPDVYSKSFVSEAERSINALPAVTIKAQPPPCLDFVRFVENFAGKGFMAQWAPPAAPLETSTNVVAAVAGNDAGDKRGLETKKFPIRSPTTGRRIALPFALDAENYGAHFLKLLAEEIAAEDKLNKSYNLYGIMISPVDLSQALFRLQLAGLRENTPMVQLGDMIKLRQVRPGLPGYFSGFTGYEYETYVYGMDKTVGYVVLRADGLWLEPGGRFNVIFGVQQQRWEGAQRATANIGKTLSVLGAKKAEESSDAERPFLRRMLFPEKSDGKMQRTLTRGVFETHWIDKELNYEQVSVQKFNFPCN